MKAAAAVTLVAALLLTCVFVYLGVTGRDMDKDGLYKLLPWLPMPGTGTRWRQALVPGADLGDTTRSTLVLKPAEGEAVTDAQLQEAVQVLSRRLNDAGWAGAQVQAVDGSLEASVPAAAAETQGLNILSAKGDVGFATPEGEVFMTGASVVNAWAGPSREKDLYAVTFQMDAQGQKLFAEKTKELVGKSISILLDGQSVAAPRISEPLTEGFASVPAFTEPEAKNLAILLRSGPLPLAVQEESHVNGAPLFGEGAQGRLIAALWIVTALIFLCLIVFYRLSGLVAAWVLLAELALMYFFAALMGAGYSLATLIAVYASFLLAAFSALMLLHGMGDDLSRGRSVQQALRASYGSAGHISLDVLGGLLAACVILIIMDTDRIGAFMRLLGVGLLTNLVLVHLVLRALLSSTIHLLGEKTALYHHRHAGAAKEAV